MDLVATAHSNRPALDMALTGALLDAVAQGAAPDTVRVFAPGPTVAFGRLDRTRVGFARAWQAAFDHGRVPVVRWGGGHAAAYDLNCVLIEIVRHQAHVIGGLEERFSDMADLVQAALAPLGIRLELGALPGEYCPGRYSLHLPGGPKIAGIAQRVIRGASLTTAALVVAGGESLRAVIAPVYAALALPLDVATAGALSDTHPDLGVEAVMRSVIQGVRRRYDATPGDIASEVAAEATGRVAALTSR